MATQQVQLLSPNSIHRFNHQYDFAKFKSHFLLLLFLMVGFLGKINAQLHTPPSCPTSYDLIWDSTPTNSGETNWPTDGSLSNFFSNVDNSGVNFTFTFTGDTGALTGWNQDPFTQTPALETNGTNGGQEVLEYFTAGFGAIGNLTLTITFSEPLYSIGYDLHHLNGPGPRGDSYILTAANTLGQTIYPTFVESNTPSYTTNASIGFADSNATSTVGDDAQLGVNFSDPSKINSITIVWDDCTACFNGDPHGSALGNFTFCKDNSCPTGYVEEITNVSASGNADVVITDTGVANGSANTTGAPDGSVAYIDGTDVLVLDLTNEVPIGENVTLRLGAFSNGNILVAASTDNINYSSPTTIFVSGSNLANYNYTVAGNNARYLRFTVSGAADIDFDAVSYNYNTNVSTCVLDACGDTDTDGDGVYDLCDLDDDNDGIFDTDEGLSDESCVNGMFQVISGNLYYLDILTGNYTQIGSAPGFIYNALAFYPENGLFYAYVKSSGFDTDGDAVASGDIVTIDPTTGVSNKIITLAQTNEGIAGDIYNGIYYFGGNGGILAYDIINGSLTQIISSNYVPNDFSIINGIAYGIQGSSFYSLNLLAASPTVNIVPITTGGSANGFGASFIFDTNRLYFSNNGGGVYEITDYTTSNPQAAYVLNSAVSGSNDGASCPYGTFIPQTIGVDSDGDGVPDHLDTDSDNDGCSDANEAYANSNADGGDGDAYGLGTPPATNPDGTVVAAAYDRGVVPAVTDAGISTACVGICTNPAGTDTDNDGINDICDIDDDNDGISDIEECNTITILSNSGGYYYIDGQVSSISENITNVNLYGLGNTLYIGSIYARDASPSSSSDYVQVTVNYGGMTYASFQTQEGTITSTSPINYSNGASGSLSVVPYSLTGTVSNSWEIYLPTSIPNTGLLQIVIDMSNKDGSTSDGVDDVGISNLSMETCSDTDSDGLPDYLDTDSDNDGCSDANEAYANYNADGGDGEAYGTGTPPLTNPDGTVIAAAYNTGIVAAVTNASISSSCADPCTDPLGLDTDNDGINDTCDLDSDNDGIPDIIEAPCNGVLSINTGSSVAGSTQNFPNFDATFRTVSGPDATLYSCCGYDGLDIFLTSVIEVSFTPNILNSEFILSDMDTGEEIRLYVYDGNGSLVPDITPYITFVGEHISANSHPTASMEAIGINFGVLPSSDTRTKLFLSFPFEVSRFTYDYHSTIDGNPELFITEACPAIDTDADNIPDYLDLDSDNDGISDIIEAGGIDTDGDAQVDYPIGGDPTTMTDSNNDGLLDILATTPLPITSTDSDGIPNYLDLDSDNDGIPDNIEGQTTAGYIAPEVTFTDTDGDGLSDVYDGDDTTVSGIGGGTGTAVVPTNTDGTFTNSDNIPDYLDLNSDNEGLDDTGEANLILSGTVGVNGLDNNIDNGDTYVDVNGTINDPTTLPNTQQGITLEVDFRELPLPNSTIAENDINQTPENTTTTGNILTNDTDNEGDNQTVQSLTYLNVSGVSQTISFNTPTNIYDSSNTLAGSLEIDTDGTYSFVPATDYTGTVPVNYVAVDDNVNPATDGATLMIEVLPDPTTDGTNNDVVAQDDTNTVEQGETVTSIVLANDSDPDGDVISVTGATGLNSIGGNISLTSTAQNIYDLNNVLAGQASIDGNGNIIFTADASFEGNVPVNYTITDSNGATDGAVLTISVEALDISNDTYANDDANTGLQGETLTGNLLDNDNDPEGNNQTVTSVISSDGTVVVPGAGLPTTLTDVGTLEVETDGSYIFIPSPDFVGTEVVIYTVCDDGNPIACETATLYLTVLPVNTTRVEDDINNTPFETAVRGDVSTNDDDLEGDNQTFTLNGSNGGMDTAEGTVTLNPNGSYLFVPANGFKGKTEFSYTSCDDGRPVVCERATVHIVVLEKINPEGQEVIGNVDANTIEAGQLGTGDVLFNDIDPDERGLQMTTTLSGINVSGLDVYGNPVANAGILTMNNDGTYNFMPTGDFTGTVVQSYTVCTTTFPAVCDNSELVIRVIPELGNSTHAVDDAIVAEPKEETIGNVLTNDRDTESDMQAVSSFSYDSNGDGKADATGTLDMDIEIGGYNGAGIFVANAGTLNMSPDGEYTFVSTSGFWGNAVVPYRVCDDKILGTACDDASLVITVLEVMMDYGDAPSRYAMAWHRAMTDDDGDGELDGLTDVWLGARASFEADQPYSDDASGDSYDDALRFGTGTGEFPEQMLPDTDYDISIILNSNASDVVYYGMWIDWNDDGTYEDFYSGSTATSGETSMDITIISPNFIGANLNVRLRADDDELFFGDFSGERTNGEVEDYQSIVTLPVELLYFEGKGTGCVNELRWATASEENNSFFMIEYSKDGENFEILEQVAGNGNSSEIIEYSYSHRDVTNVYSYYRLLQVDYDGTFDYSEVVFIKSDCQGLSLDGMNIYPNPSFGQIKAEMLNDTEMDKEIEIMVTDAMGRVLIKKDVILKAGLNRENIDLSSYSTGVYMVSIIEGGKNIETYPINLIMD